MKTAVRLPKDFGRGAETLRLLNNGRTVQEEQTIAIRALKEAASGKSLADARVQAEAALQAATRAEKLVKQEQGVVSENRRKWEAAYDQPPEYRKRWASGEVPVEPSYFDASLTLNIMLGFFCFGLAVSSWRLRHALRSRTPATQGPLQVSLLADDRLLFRTIDEEHSSEDLRSPASEDLRSATASAASDDIPAASASRGRYMLPMRDAGPNQDSTTSREHGASTKPRGVEFPASFFVIAPQVARVLANEEADHANEERYELPDRTLEEPGPRHRSRRRPGLRGGRARETLPGTQSADEARQRSRSRRGEDAERPRARRYESAPGVDLFYIGSGSETASSMDEPYSAPEQIMLSGRRPRGIMHVLSRDGAAEPGFFDVHKEGAPDSEQLQQEDEFHPPLLPRRLDEEVAEDETRPQQVEQPPKNPQEFSGRVIDDGSSASSQESIGQESRGSDNSEDITYDNRGLPDAQPSPRRREQSWARIYPQNMRTRPEKKETVPSSPPVPLPGEEAAVLPAASEDGVAAFASLFSWNIAPVPAAAEGGPGPWWNMLAPAVSSPEGGSGPGPSVAGDVVVTAGGAADGPSDPEGPGSVGSSAEEEAVDGELDSGTVDSSDSPAQWNDHCAGEFPRGERTEFRRSIVEVNTSSSGR